MSKTPYTFGNPGDLVKPIHGAAKSATANIADVFKARTAIRSHNAALEHIAGENEKNRGHERRMSSQDSRQRIKEHTARTKDLMEAAATIHPLAGAGNIRAKLGDLEFSYRKAAPKTAAKTAPKAEAKAAVKTEPKVAAKPAAVKSSSVSKAVNNVPTKTTAMPVVKDATPTEVINTPKRTRSN
ncbi:hypothetical protein UFOVP46_128 [uncultured Caudovirales phage]|uniref:Uncharacterized protein n=1 Tax=uncultured Caudovirales phage TaxID=2100421 RepID=A0A6J5KS93_9CAUD|nr:hypothetical protein UFOVP46_128 [uncultured Caudovirales phage]